MKRIRIGRFVPAVILAMIACTNPTIDAQNFDFGKLSSKVEQYTVIIDMTIEVSFGMNSSEIRQRFLGTIVSDDGMAIFNGSVFSNETGFSLRGLTVRTKPLKIEAVTLGGISYRADFIGVDRFTDIGLIQLQPDNDIKFQKIEFAGGNDFNVGEWLTLYMLMPEFVEPPLAADIGMISSLVELPEAMPLTVGFGSLQAVSVLYNEQLIPVGVLGPIVDPSFSNANGGGFGDQTGQFPVPLLGVISGDRIQKIVADPPRKGSNDRGWLGISLQALTKDLAEFWDLDIEGGIIVNEVIKGSPAERAGLKVGDIIYELGGGTIGVDREDKLPLFQRSIAELGPEALVEFSLFRPQGNNMESHQIIVILGRAPLAASDAEEYESESLELTVRNLVFSDYMFLNLDEETFHGIIISGIKQGGLADVGGLSTGDIVQKINSEEIKSVEDAGRAIERLEESRPGELIFFIWRANKTMFVNVKTDWNSGD